MLLNKRIIFLGTKFNKWELILHNRRKAGFEIVTYFWFSGLVKFASINVYWANDSITVFSMLIFNSYLFIYLLFERQGVREKDLWSTGSFPKMPPTARARPVHSQKTEEAPSGSPTWVTGSWVITCGLPWCTLGSWNLEQSWDLNHTPSGDAVFQLVP